MKVKVGEALTDRSNRRSEFKVSALMRARPLLGYITNWSYRHVAYVHDTHTEVSELLELSELCVYVPELINIQFITYFNLVLFDF